jgi:hypothetical protein
MNVSTTSTAPLANWRIFVFQCHWNWNIFDNDAMNKPSCQAPVRRVVLDNSDALMQICQQEGPLFVNVYLPTRYGIALYWLAI